MSLDFGRLRGVVVVLVSREVVVIPEIIFSEVARTVVALIELILVASVLLFLLWVVLLGLCCLVIESLLLRVSW